MNSQQGFLIVAQAAKMKNIPNVISMRDTPEAAAIRNLPVLLTANSAIGETFLKM